MDIKIIFPVILIGWHQVRIKYVGTTVFARKAYLYGVGDGALHTGTLDIQFLMKFVRSCSILFQNIPVIEF